VTAEHCDGALHDNVPISIWNGIVPVVFTGMWHCFCFSMSTKLKERSVVAWLDTLDASREGDAGMSLVILGV
jgi:hypothetical protein